MRRALQTGTEAPPELVEFDIEQSFWQRFGARLSPERLAEWPRQKLEKYRDILRVMSEVERERAAASGGDAAAGTQSPQETERVFQEMARRNREKQQH